MEKKQKKKNPIFGIAVIIGVILLPLAYSLFYLGAFWDPYSRLEDLSVAVVNNDAGGTIGGSTRNLGDELVATLSENAELNWVFTDEADAINGVEGTDYYAVLLIPEDFTADIASAATTDKEVPTITYTSNEKRNFLATQIINRAVLEVESQLQSSINAELTAQLAQQIEGVPDSLSELSDGLSELADGSATLETGLTSFTAGQQTLSDGTVSLDDGLAQLVQGMTDLQAGLAQLDEGLSTADAGTKEMLAQVESSVDTLSQGIANLQQGAADLSSSVEAYTEGVNQLLAANTSLTENMAGILNSQTLTSDQKVAMMGQVLAAVNTEDNQALLAQLAAAGPQLTTGAQALEEGIEAFSSGAGGLNTLVSGLETLSTALDQLEEGTASAVSGSSTLQAGLTQAKAGSEALVSGAQTLLDAGTQLEEGSAALSDGIETAQTSVDSAVAEAQTQIEALDGLSEYAEDPVNVEESPLYEVPNYGTAFAPYFMSLSLYVGALIMFVGLYLDIDEKIKILARNSENKFIRVAIFALIGVAQALLLALLVKYALGLTIANTAMYYLSCILVSMVFITIVEFFFVILGDAGKFLAMLLLILQLTSCGGTFPMETVPKFFQVLYPYMPMTYSVLLFKETISGYDAATANHAIVILLLFFAGFLALTLLFSAGKKGHQKHHPDVKENAVLTA